MIKNIKLRIEQKDIEIAMRQYFGKDLGIDLDEYKYKNSDLNREEITIQFSHKDNQGFDE